MEMEIKSSIKSHLPLKTPFFKNQKYTNSQNYTESKKWYRDTNIGIWYSAMQNYTKLYDDEL